MSSSLQHDVDADAHVRRHHDRDVARRARRSRPSARRVKPVVPMTCATPSSRHTASCASVPSGRVKSISTSARGERRRAASAVIGTPLALPRKRRRRLADRRAAGDVERAGEHESALRADRLDQRPAHAAGGAGDGDAQALRRSRAARAADVMERRLERRVGAVRRRRGTASAGGWRGGAGSALRCSSVRASVRRAARWSCRCRSRRRTRARPAGRRRFRCSPARRPRTARRRGAAAARRPGGGS